MTAIQSTQSASVREGIGSVSASALAVPDPYLPTLACYAVRGTTDTIAAPTDRVGQRQRRAQILATTRRLLSERGYEGVLIQDLADICGLSKQSVYNLVGNKRKVIADSVVDHVMSMARIAHEFGKTDKNILCLIELYCLNFTTNPDYTRRAAIGMFQRDRALCTGIRSKQKQLIRTWLHKQRMEGLLRDCVDVELLSGHIAVLNESNILDWAHGSCSVRDLCRNIITGHGFMLLGATRPTESPKIEAWMERAF